MNKLEKFFSEYWNTLKAGVFIVSLIGVFFAFDNYINRQIENKISDSDYVESLAETLRPFCVFDESGIIVYDHGAEQFINEISLNEEKEGVSTTKTITVELARYFQNAPLLITVGANQYSYEAIKKDNKTFVYTLSAPSLLELAESKKVADNKYILEILK